ncbi:MAG: dCTP deaminase [Blastocatellia bacterium]|jgi:dCTP deaminase|nr:dCTP deaminase [Blastocatellia bacterium]
MSLNLQTLIQRMSPMTHWDERLVVEPFFPESVDMESSSNSLDFHLGNRFTILRSRRSSQHDPLSQDPKRDVVVRELFIPMGKEFTLNPGQIVLGTTLEWFRFPYDLMAYVIGRSIWGRRGLLIVTASAVHPGSSGTITLEMSNLSEVGLHLRPGAAIGQLFFNQVDVGSNPGQRRSPNFTGALRPIIGTYSLSKVEDLLLKLE